MDQIVKPLYENKNENAIKCMHKTFYQSKNSNWNILNPLGLHMARVRVT